MRLKYAYILPVGYILFFLIDETLKRVILSISPLQDLGLLGLFFQIWFLGIHIIIDAPTGVFLQVFGIEPGVISVIVISLGVYFLFGTFLDFYDILPWRRNA